MDAADRAPRLPDLLDLLDREGVALRQGDLAALAALLPEKERAGADPAALAGALAAAEPNLRRRIAAAARRNDALLAGLRDGMRAALERLGAVARACEGLRTYDRAGNSALLAQGTPRPIRRA